MKILLILAVVGLSEGFFFGKRPDWGDLRVRFGTPISDFRTQPRTVQEARAQGFTPVGGCSASNGYMGTRYVKNGNTAVMLLFDKNGFIAGIQAGLPKNLPNGYPDRSSHRDLFISEGSKYVITAYFTNPEKICSEGRSSNQFDTEGTGNGLFIQSGANPVRDFITIPMTESAIARTKWTKGKCFYWMGRHYWYDVTSNMDCKDFFPMFLLYNSGKLDGFGWAFGADLSEEVWEHPSASTFNLGLFIDPVPRCLVSTTTRLSTLHVYMSNPYSNFC
ncbi:unnamed protein product [Owenia fusiformis]|uniref:Uncharacterized protein n=1 Tax=Owenia fusiformis TaxID=6347 RepID=A0A8J1T5G5_OWEFU|nr:unnamed protein product [Owenia fusiformis]